MINCNRCDKEASDGCDFTAELPKIFQRAGMKSSMSGRFCSSCAFEMFGPTSKQLVYVKFTKMPEEHTCVGCLEEDCDCGGSPSACNECSECRSMLGQEP